MSLKKLLQRIDRQPVSNPQHVIKQKLENFNKFYAISRFEDVVITPEAKKLNVLVAQGKVTADQAARIAAKYA